MKIINCNKNSNKDKIEKECGFVYFNDGVTIMRKLLSVCLYGKNKDCIGLAHNQIGGNKKVFVAKIDNKWSGFINSEIIETSDTYNTHTESCMSFPNKFNKVKRYDWVIIRHQIKSRTIPQDDAFINEKFEGRNSQIIQHEIAHLEGKHIFSASAAVSGEIKNA